MLRYLSIQRLAVIDALDVEFATGLNVLTGETGAGKSIIVGAVELLLGGRASADMVRTGADTAVVQAVLDAQDGREIIVRREVSAAGRSRAFADGELVTSAALRELTGPLVDLHGQHEHQALLATATHVDLLDRYAEAWDDRLAVSDAFGRWQRARDALASSRHDARERAARLDAYAFQIAEIDRVGPGPGEDEALEAERLVLANVDRLQRAAGEAYAELYESETAAVARLRHVWRRVEELAALDRRFADFVAARAGIDAQLDELTRFLSSYLASLEASPERLQAVEDRLAQLDRIKKRYGPALDDVRRRRAALGAELEALGSGEGREAELARDVEVTAADYLRLARALSKRRRDTAAGFGRALARELADLAMPHARFEVRFAPDAPTDAGWGPSGIDAVEFYLSPNPGEDPRPLARIASGGELSRVMLALKTLASTDAPGKALVFDEVDAGIGGTVADVVGARLRRLGRRCQVLCITHLPQVAAHGDHHYRVEKGLDSGRTVTRITCLRGSARERELARMIGGVTVTSGVLESAREMLATRRGNEENTKQESESSKAKARRAT